MSSLQTLLATFSVILAKLTRMMSDDTTDPALLHSHMNIPLCITCAHTYTDLQDGALYALHAIMNERSLPYSCCLANCLRTYMYACACTRHNAWHMVHLPHHMFHMGHTYFIQDRSVEWSDQTGIEWYAHAQDCVVCHDGSISAMQRRTNYRIDLSLLSIRLRLQLVLLSWEWMRQSSVLLYFVTLHNHVVTARRGLWCMWRHTKRDERKACRENI